MKRLHALSTYALLLLGAVHALATPVFYPALTVDALWFMGSGVALVFLGLLNLAAQRSPATTRPLALIGNALGLAWGVALPFVLPEPQALLASVALAGAFVGSARR